MPPRAILVAIHPSADVYLTFFHILAIANNALVNLGLHVSF